jgi:sec-independent protein translocase protein TatA
MGLGGISIWQLLIILAIVVMLFGTKRLRTLGSDLGSAVKGFRSSMQDDDAKPMEKEAANGDGEGGNDGASDKDDKRDA